MYRLYKYISTILTFSVISIAFVLTSSSSYASNRAESLPHSERLYDVLPQVIVPQAGQTFYVDSTTGNDNNNGSEGSPFRTFSYALTQLSPGDTLILKPGFYQEYNVFWDTLDSNQNSPVTTIKAENPGTAIITAAWMEAYNGTLSWQLVDPDLGLYKAPQRLINGNRIHSYYAHYNGTFLPYYKQINDLREARITAGISWGVGDKIFQMPSYGFTHQDGFTYLRLPNKQDPNGKSVMFSGEWPENERRERIWSIDNAENLLIDGLKFEGFYGTGIYFRHGHVAVRNTIFEYVRTGVRFRESSIIEWSEYSFPGFNEFAIAVDALNFAETKKYNNLYPYVKHYHSKDGEAVLEGHLYDSAGTDIYTGFEARYNFLHNAFDGGRIGEFHDSSSHHNVYLYLMDNAEEFETWTSHRRASNLHFHNNLILASNYGPISHQGADGGGVSGDVAGPQYIYRNVIIGYDDRGWAPWTVFKTSGSDGDDHYKDDSSNPVIGEFARNGIYYYHNTVYIKKGNLYWYKDKWANTLDNLHFFNNILLFEEELDQNGPEIPWSASQTGGNILVAQSDYTSLTHNNGIFLNNNDFQNHMGALFNHPSLGLASSTFDFTLSSNPNNPAVGRAIVPSGNLTDVVANAQDVGAFELGEPIATLGGEWPRPVRRIFDSAPFGNPPIPVEPSSTPPIPPIPPTPSNSEVQVDPNHGRPIINLPNDSDVSWYYIYVGKQENNILTTVHLQWHEKAKMQCNLTCEFMPEIHPINGDYVVYIKTWGGKGFSTGGIDGWAGPFAFNIDEPALTNLNLEAMTDTSSNSPTFQWDAADGATWYQLWVGTEDFETRYFAWHSALDIQCHGGGVCRLKLDSTLSKNQSHIWYLRAWGPGGFSSGGEDGWYKGNTFIMQG